MSRSILFGCSVTREDGRLLVAIEGERAEEVIAYFARRTRFAGSRFSPEHLGSPSIGLTSLFAGNEVAAPAADTCEEPDLAQVFGQGFDRPYAEYEARLKAYRDILAAEAQAEDEDAEAPHFEAKAPEGEPTRSGRREAREKPAP